MTRNSSFCPPKSALVVAMELVNAVGRPLITFPVKSEPRLGLAVAAIKKVAHGVAASGVEFGIRLLFLGRGLRFVFGTAIGTTIGEAGLVGLQLKFF